MYASLFWSPIHQNFESYHDSPKIAYFFTLKQLYDQNQSLSPRPTLRPPNHHQLAYQTCLKPYLIPKPNWPKNSKMTYNSCHMHIMTSNLPNPKPAMTWPQNPIPHLICDILELSKPYLLTISHQNPKWPILYTKSSNFAYSIPWPQIYAKPDSWPLKPPYIILHVLYQKPPPSKYQQIQDLLWKSSKSHFLGLYLSPKHKPYGILVPCPNQ